MKKISLFVMMLALILTGCATKVVGLQKDKSLTYESMQSGPLVIGGVVDAANEKPVISNINSMNQLRGQLAEETEGLSIARSGLVRATIGSRTYKKILQEYRDDSSLSEKSISLLAQKLKGKRYLIFSRIQRDEPFQDRSESKDVDSKGNDTGSKSINMVSGRAVDATFDIVDLHLKKTVWSGLIKKEKRNQQSYKYSPTKKDNSGFGGLINLVKTIKGTDGEAAPLPDYKYPKSPSTQSILPSLFAGFAENLPEKS